MHRVYNFSAGPAALPEAVLKRAQSELLDYQGLGMSVMEISHRGKVFTELAENTEAVLRKLLGVPDDYAVLFTHGGATAQFSAVPLNLTRPGQSAAYVHTGSWSGKAIAEARRYCDVQVIASSQAQQFTCVPEQQTWTDCVDPGYVHICLNETIEGVAFPFMPQTRAVPLVADCSSCIMSAPMNVRDFGVIYAGAQKNMGPAGLALVIVHRALLGQARKETPGIMNWELLDKSGSMYNTPPTYAWYLTSLVFDWLLEQGGLPAIAQINQRKAQTLYAAIDAIDFYTSPVVPQCRSQMNVPFVLADPALDASFLSEADAAGLTNLKGHRSVGGMRASLYNAVSQQAVDALVDFMGDFARRCGVSHGYNDAPRARMNEETDDGGTFCTLAEITRRDRCH